jgi:uncharacterized Fe-S cluster protein YjdI/CDGSH-type Zn-finger protein
VEQKVRNFPCPSSFPDLIFQINRKDMSEEKRIQEYKNEQITVRFNPNICAHAAVCIKQLPTVFDIKRQRWIDVNGDTVENIVALIAKCPSGALTFELPDPIEEETKPTQEPVVITVSNSLKIAGRVRIVDTEGNLILETDKCSLCRCGHSEKKPFCDGAHKLIGWKG